MTLDKLQSTISASILFIPMAVGAFLIAISDKSLTLGIIIYGIALHIKLIILMCLVYDKNWLESVVKTALENQTRSKYKKYITRFLGIILWASFTTALAYKERWYLFIVTIIVFVLLTAVVRMANREVKRRRKEDTS